MLATLYFHMGNVDETTGEGLPAPARREQFERACAFYSLASEVHGRLKAAGTLEAVRRANSAETALALARCRGDSNH